MKGSLPNDPPTLWVEALEPRIAPAGDLIATITSVSLPSTFVPGDHGSVKFTVQNIAPASTPSSDNTAEGLTGIHIYMSLDTAVNSGDAEIGKVQNVNFNLKPGATKSFTGQIDIEPLYLSYPTPAPGNYYILVQVDPPNRITETNESNNVAASGQTFVYAFQFGEVVGHPGVTTLKGYDQNFDEFSITLKGGGTGTIVPGATTDISFANTTDKSAASATFLGSTIRNISAPAVMKSIVFPGATVTGDVTLTGGIESLVLGNTGGANADITIGGSKPVKQIILGQVNDLNISVPTGIAKLQVIDWNAVGTDTISAGFITKLLSVGAPKVGIDGNFDASLNLSGTGAPKNVSLDFATIAGSLLGGTWTIAGTTSIVGDISAHSADTWKLDSAGWVESILMKGDKDLPGFLSGDKSAGGFTVRAQHFDDIVVLGSVDAKIVATDADVFNVAIEKFVAGSMLGAVITTPVGGIKSLGISEWVGGGSLTAEWLGKMIVSEKLASGDFDADVTVTGIENTGGLSIDSVRIEGALKDSVWSVADYFGILIARTMSNSSLSVTADFGVLLVGNSLSNAAFQSSIITVSGGISTVVFVNVDESGTGSTYGLTADTIGQYTRYVGKTKAFTGNDLKNFTGVVESTGKYQLNLTS